MPNGIFAFRLGKRNIVFGRPANHFPLNYVENLVEAMQAAAATGTGLREYNVLDDDELTLARYHVLKSTMDGSTIQIVCSPCAGIERSSRGIFASTASASPRRRACW